MNAKFDIKSYLTAINSTKLSKPTFIALTAGHLSPVILDWGCGKGRDTRWLNNHGLSTIGFDPYFSPIDVGQIDFNQIKSILVIYVLNVIDNPYKRNELLFQLKTLAQPKTKLIFAVRSEKHIKRLALKGSWSPFEDGFITKKQTFQVGYSLNRLIAETKALGALVESIENSTFVFTVIEKNDQKRLQVDNR